MPYHGRYPRSVPKGSLLLFGITLCAVIVALSMALVLLPPSVR